MTHNFGVSPRLRILILDNEFPPLGGGTGVVNLHLMEDLDALGVECHLVTSSRTRNQHEFEAFGTNGRIYKVPVNNHNLHHSSYRELLRYTWRGLRQAWRLQHDSSYDVCLAYSTVPAGFIAFWLQLWLKLPYITITQGPDIPWHEERHYWLYSLLKPIIKLIWRRAAAVTATSTASRDEIWTSAPHLPVQVIVNGVDIDRFAPTGASMRQRGGSLPLTFLCVGRLIALKGYQHLLSAAALLDERGDGDQFRIVLVGTGDHEDQLRAQAERLNLASRVTFAGVVTHDDMPRFYAQADVFVLPSYAEGMSLALLEALAAGLPAIVTPTGGTQELINGNGFIVEWADPTGLADALTKFLQDPRLCGSLGEKGRQLVQRFSWSVAAESYLKLCRQVISQTKSG